MKSYKDYMLFDKLPQTWCAGCSHGIVLQSIAAVMAELEVDKHDMALVSGIGCFGRVDDYLDINCMHVTLDINCMHATHGRALAAATGVALGNPNLNVLVTMGDGDGTTIGGNHLIHAARRNINVTAIISNNYNYGQTGGQYSATTPTHSITQTSPYGHVEQAFDICQLAIAAGASYVGRATAYNPLMIRKLIKEGMQVKGFSLIEVMSACPTHYGKFNKLGEASRMLKLMNEQSVTVSQAAKLSPEELKGKLVVGCLKNEPRDDYYTEYARIIEAQKVED
ncbi:thiamine pyrophosphate-dependent enzyme [Acidaminococcus intestini]|uniref:thiamine pyrophosphate-dependent enzyme n=1 Tax=Acidaminococcus intestini TaxID=187327 RepID=UPI0003369ADB|nr:thiamine pyrophosphate-dependent enzyme [Acidaminococcus intestini]CDB93364.1 2-oxoglutarate ferredoxin oxidoreductase subunit beta [Acidaminococcus intestini CAG:325]